MSGDKPQNRQVILILARPVMIVCDQAKVKLQRLLIKHDSNNCQKDANNSRSCHHFREAELTLDKGV